MVSYVHHKQKAKREADLRRKRANRDPYDLVLIVCEDAKAEPNYFTELRNDFRLNTANIRIAKKVKRHDPLYLVNYALAEYRKEPEYDRIYCVFDRDNHAGFEAARSKMGHIKKRPRVFEPIPSYPCFEFWLLLHFEFTTRPFRRCTSVIRRLKKHLPHYEKARTGMFYETKDKLDTALTNAAKLQACHRSAGTTNPGTRVHELVEYLMGLQR